MIDYYARRAPEYERIYELPERQQDLGALRGLVRDLVAGKDVLEVACGTGYWTEAFAAAARSVTATDAGLEVLDVARRKSYPAGRVRFALADAYCLPAPRASFDAAVAGFWWSHVQRRRVSEFLAGLHRCLVPGARVVLFDNRFVAGSSTAISRRDDEGNTYQRRRLAAGGEHEVMKNFPEPDELRAAAALHGARGELIELRFYWCLTYLLPAEMPEPVRAQAREEAADG